MALSFAFGGNTGQSYDQLQRRRMFAEAMMQRGMNSQPKTAIEGLNSAASSIMGALISKKVGAQEDNGREAYNSTFADIIGGGPRQPSMTGPAVGPVSGPDPNAPATIGDQAMAALGKGSNNFQPGDRDSFISAMMPHAVEASKMTGVDPRLIIAQAAQETGWGAHAPGNNYFGIKSHGQGGGNTMATTEYVNGQPVTVNDSFRGYGDMRESALGYANFLLENPRYQPMLNAEGLDAQVAALGASGYATDPNYAASVGNIANGIDPRLIEAMGNPYATDAQRSALSMLFEQQVAAAQPPDPMKAIELQKAQLELAQMQNPQMPESVTERLILAKQAGLQPGTPEYSTYMATGELPGAGEAPAAFASLDLQAQAAGYAPGTPEYQEFMRNGGGSGAPAAFVALDLQAKAAGFQPGTPEYQEFMATRGAGLIAEAKLKGEDIALLDSTESKMEGLETVVSELDALADEATYTYAGRAYDALSAQLGREPRDAAVARSEYIAKVDNQVLPMLRDTFGAAFTVKEGETLRATLGDPNKTPTEKKAVLRAFIDQKKRDVEALRTRTGTAPAPADDAEYLKSLGLE